MLFTNNIVFFGTKMQIKKGKNNNYAKKFTNFWTSIFTLRENVDLVFEILHSGSKSGLWFSTFFTIQKFFVIVKVIATIQIYSKLSWRFKLKKGFFSYYNWVGFYLIITVNKMFVFTGMYQYCFMLKLTK